MNVIVKYSGYSAEFEEVLYRATGVRPDQAGDQPVPNPAASTTAGDAFAVSVPSHLHIRLLTYFVGESEDRARELATAVWRAAQAWRPAGLDLELLFVPPLTPQAAADEAEAQLKGTLPLEEEAERNREAAAWRETAEQCQRNTDYYRGLVVRIGKLFGLAARTSDDGSVQEDILVAKVPELVEALFRECAQPVEVQEVRGAVARGWCHPANASKEMDGDLAEAITAEVLSLLSGTEIRPQDLVPPSSDEIRELERMMGDPPTPGHEA